jgi:hypothetical protein
VIIIQLKVTNETAYSTELLESIVQFATPEDWRHLRQDADSSYPITFREGNYELLQGEFNGGAITINIPHLLRLPFYGNRVIQRSQGPAILGGGYLPEKYQLPEDEQLPLVNFTEWLLAHVAHEIHHAYLHWLNPENYVNALKPLSAAQTEQENACERYAISVLKRWGIEDGKKDLPFAQLKGIRKRVRNESERVDEIQSRFNRYHDKLAKGKPD